MADDTDTTTRTTPADGRTKEAAKTSIRDRLERVAVDFGTLRVITMVADVELEFFDDGTGGKTLTQLVGATNKKAFITQIDLVDGDLLAVLPTGHESMPQAAKLHAANVETGSQVLPTNVSTVVNAATSIINAFDNL